MLEGPTFLVSRELPSACEQESRWAYNAFCVTELAKGKRYLDDGGDEATRLKKSWKRTQKDILVHELSRLSASDQSENQKQEDQSDTSSLINPLGRDASIGFLSHTSRSDYGAIASLNGAFRSLVCEGELYRTRRKMGIIGYWVYFSCNLFEWEAFNPIRCRWMRLPTMDYNECFMCSDKESLAVGTKLLVFGKEIDKFVVVLFKKK
ncbi:hypothetical protein Tco_0413794 [Tanacetum coccineum]